MFKRLDNEGFALEATLFVLVLISALVAVSFTGVITVTRTANYDYRNSRVAYAAEGGADAIMAQVAVAMEDGALTNEELDAVVAPSIAGFTFDRLEVSRVGTIQIETITDGPFAGLYSLTQRLDIEADVRDGIDNESHVIVSAKAQAIPIFQFGIFYEKDLEATNGPPMEFAGWVHSNGNIYLSSNNAWYRDVITTPNSAYHNRKDANTPLNGVYVNDASGNEVPLDFDSRSIPDPNAFRSASETRMSGRLKTSAFGVDTLRVPLPTGVGPEEVVAPRDAGDGSLERSAKFAWKADWYIEFNPPMGGNTCNRITSTRSAGKLLPTNSECVNIFNYTTEAFYEGRQGRLADVFDVDLVQLNNWVSANPAGETNVLYITFTGLVPDPSGDGRFPVVRVRNATNLRNPLTIATNLPIYVWGNYNIGAWQPSALVGDAITILSNAWTDAANQGPGMQVASNTTVYAAVLAGHTPTACDWFVCGTNPYGGGIENYLRFLENWSASPRRTLSYKGSLVSLSFSQSATAPWSYGVYYTAPTRDWQFDTRFEDPQNLPPGTPTVGSVIHTAFRPVY